jgi:hypothetical protein
MKPNDKEIRPENRSTAKKAARRNDAMRISQGFAPEAIQRENSIFPPGYFDQHRIRNFASAIGK